MAVLFGIEDESDVLSIDQLGPDQVRILIEMRAWEAPCPTCGVVTARVKDRPVRRIKDLPVAGQRTQLWWRKRRLACVEALCPRRSFTRPSVAVRPRARVTERLRVRVAEAIAGGNRAVSEVAAEYGVSWPTAHQALVAAAARWLPAPTPTSRLGIDETRFRSVRWLLEGITWKQSDPWLTSFVDCSTDGPGSLLGLAPGRTGACVRDWLGEQTPAFRDRIQLVVIDPSAPYPAGIRTALPHAKIAVDKWHLVALANQMVTEVRQRVTREQLGRRGTTADPRPTQGGDQTGVLVGDDQPDPGQAALLAGAQEPAPEHLDLRIPDVETEHLPPAGGGHPGGDDDRHDVTWPVRRTCR